MRKLLTGVACIAGILSPASAYELGALFRKHKPEARLTAAHPISDVEQCVVFADLPAPPVIYRFPEPDRVLVHGGRYNKTMFAYELVGQGGQTEITVWQGSGSINDIRKCL